MKKFLKTLMDKLFLRNPSKWTDINCIECPPCPEGSVHAYKDDRGRLYETAALRDLANKQEKLANIEYGELQNTIQKWGYRYMYESHLEILKEIREAINKYEAIYNEKTKSGV